MISAPGVTPVIKYMGKRDFAGIIKVTVQFILRYRDYPVGPT